MADMSRIAAVIAAHKTAMSGFKKQKAKDRVVNSDLYLDQQLELLEWVEKNTN